jgi:RNA 3'-terminal phosphate cyclase (ATP)
VIQSVLRPASSSEASSQNAAPYLHPGNFAVANLTVRLLRQKHQALRRLEPLCRDTKIKTLNLPSPGKGTFILLMAEFEHGTACYTALGEKGKPAEKVADEACDRLQFLLEQDEGIDEYLADQLLLPLALAQGPSKISTARLTDISSPMLR